MAPCLTLLTFATLPRFCEQAFSLSGVALTHGKNVIIVCDDVGSSSTETKSWKAMNAAALDVEKVLVTVQNCPWRFNTIMATLITLALIMATLTILVPTMKIISLGQGLSIPSQVRYLYFYRLYLYIYLYYKFKKFKIKRYILN